MKTIIELNYIAHNGSSLLLKENIEFVPGIGTIIENESLSDSSCTGFFVVINSTCNREDNKSYKCIITALETNREIYKENLEQFIEQLIL